MKSCCRVLRRVVGLSTLLVAVCCGGCGEKGPPEYPAAQVFWFPDSSHFEAKALAFSPDGRFLAIGLPGRGKNSGRVNRAVLLEDGQTKIYHMKEIPSWRAKGVVNVVDLASQNIVAAGMILPMWVNSLAFSPDGKAMVAGTGNLEYIPDAQGRYRTVPSEGAIVFWDTDSWEKTDEWKVPGAVLEVVVSPDGKYLAAMSSKSSSETGTEVRIWDIATREEKAQWALDKCYMPLRPNDPIQPLAFSPDGTRLAAMDCRRDSYAQSVDSARLVIWNVQTAEEVQSLDAGPFGNSVTFSQDGRRLIAGLNGDGSVSVWNTQTWQLERFDRAPYGAEILLDDTRRLYLTPGHFRGPRRCGIVRCDDDEQQGELVAWLVSPNTREPQMRPGNILALAVSPDGKRIAAAGRGEEVCVWNTPNLPEAE